MGYEDAAQLVSLGISDPELACGVLGYRDGLHTALGYGYRKTSVERVAIGRGMVTVAQKAGAVLVQARLRRCTDHVEVVVLPQGVGPGRVARVDEYAGVFPNVLCPVVAEDMILLRQTVEQYPPPKAVVEPQLALRFRGGGSLRAPDLRLEGAWQAQGYPRQEEDDCTEDHQHL